jgi:methylglyoxal synthase
MLTDELALPVECVEGGPYGGDLQIGARVVEGQIDAVVFLRDPLTAHPHEPDIQALLKVCDVHGVPLATNRASAEILLHVLARRPPRDFEGIFHPSVLPAGCFPWDSADRVPEPDPR